MNCSNKFKLTAVAMMVGTAMNANAALYQVVEVEPESNGDIVNYETAYGVAIQQGDVQDVSTGSPFVHGCFDSAAGCTTEQFKLALETRTTPISAGEAVDGVSYREEVPFAMDSGFYYVQEYNDFERYCNEERRYSTCESWASIHWQPWGKELGKDFTTNSFAFVEGEESAYANEYNNIINSLTKDAKPVGNQSVVSTSDSSELKSRNTIVAPVIPDITTEEEQAEVVQSHAWHTDSSFTVGSVSRKASNTNGTHHTSKAAIWDETQAIVEIPWLDGVPAKDGERLAQGSMRDLVVDTDTKAIYGVGYNTWRDDNYMNATVFVGSLKADTDAKSIKNYDWKNVLVDGAQQRIDGDTVHSNSRLTGVNSNFVAIGEAKRSGRYLMPTGSAANRLFIVNDVTQDSVKAFFPTTGIFFSGAGGHMGAINSYNEIVGQLDAETTREQEGKPRRKRGFIYPYTKTGEAVSQRATDLFEGKPWFLDNLTNGGEYSADNNAFRIINATDINDAGVISATAMKCEGGYKSTQHNASCDGTEKIVAVKLMPIAGATSADIQQRSVEEESAERQGAGLGWLALTMLGFFGFRRK